MKIQLLVPVYVSTASLYPVIERFFNSVYESYPQLEIVAIDDASPLPPSPDWPISLVNEQNLGFTKTVNKLLSMSDADVMIVANDDLFIKQGELDWAMDITGKKIISPRDTASSPDDRFGSIWAITKEAFQELGLLDERFKHFFSDLEYYHRAKRLGIEIIKLSEPVIDHLESATFNTINKDELLAKDREAYSKFFG